MVMPPRESWCVLPKFLSRSMAACRSSTVGFSRRVPRLPDGDGFRKHLFGRAVLAGADGILDDTFNPGGETDSHHEPPYTKP